MSDAPEPTTYHPTPGTMVADYDDDELKARVTLDFDAGTIRVQPHYLDGSLKPSHVYQMADYEAFDGDMRAWVLSKKALPRDLEVPA